MLADNAETMHMNETILAVKEYLIYLEQVKSSQY